MLEDSIAFRVEGSFKGSGSGFLKGIFRGSVKGVRP